VGAVVIRAVVVVATKAKVVGAVVADGLRSKNSVVAAVAVSAVGSQVASRAVAATEYPT
jgi:hypothetical protein